MLYNILYPLAGDFSFFSFMGSVSSRAVLAFFTALVLSLLFGGKLIAFLKAHQKKGQPIRDDGPQTHLSKKGTPTMGGLLILGTSIVSILLFASIKDPLVWICLLVLVVYGFVGFVDDYVKVTKETSNAMTVKMKLFLQFTTALIAVGVVSYFTPEESRYTLSIPYFKSLGLNLWLFYVPFAMVVIVGTSNAVNLSDGLDTLAGGLLIISFAVFMVFAFVCGTDIAQYFYITPIPNASELAIVCAAVIGACVGFIWFNAPPAKVFMGDTGSLALGALLGTIAVMVKQEIVLAIVGGVFVMEALSVMIQVSWFKYTKGKRIFKMAPLHHHFEQCGWAETTVVFRFFIAALVLGIIGLLALNIR